jgi:RNA polymerase sigma-70 factor (ECF subfamily)
LWKEHVLDTVAGALLNEEQDLEEQDLIGRAQRGEEQAYQALVQQYEQIAFRTAYLITHDEHEAAEAAQEAFVRAFRALHSFKLGLPFRPWLLRIVTNLALNRVQSRQRRLKMEERYIREQAVTPDPSVDAIIADKEQHQHLLQAVSRLSAQDQALISLRYFLELPESEVAQALNIPIGTVKSRLHRTLARLRELIRRDFPDLEPIVS